MEKQSLARRSVHAGSWQASVCLCELANTLERFSRCGALVTRLRAAEPLFVSLPFSSPTNSIRMYCLLYLSIGSHLASGGVLVIRSLFVPTSGQTLAASCANDGAHLLLHRRATSSRAPCFSLHSPAVHSGFPEGKCWYASLRRVPRMEQSFIINQISMIVRPQTWATRFRASVCAQTLLAYFVRRGSSSQVKVLQSADGQKRG